ncbi:MAG: DNRLRE domain-containing protein, partial [bacterium]
SGPVGTVVTVSGSHFTGATLVQFNNVSAVFTAPADGKIIATVPGGAATGTISVTTPGGTAMSASDFTVTQSSGILKFNPSDDAFVWEKRPSNNYATSPELRLRRTRSAKQITYLKFNVTGIAGAVTSAQLRVTVLDGSDDGGSIYSASNTFFGGNTPWNEEGLTWPNAPEMTSPALSSLGAVTAGTIHEYDVTSAITGDKSYSFAITSRSSDVCKISSKEGATAPELIINYGDAPVYAEFPQELVDFTPYAGNPVFTAQGAGHWDERIRERGWITREGGIYRMWYTGYVPKSPKKLGYATSSDGLNWQRFAGNPIHDQHWVEDMMVVKYLGQYYMFAEGLNDRAQLLTSEDGISWTRLGQLDIRLTNGQPIPDVAFGTPTAWVTGGVWHLLYDRNGDEAIWLATSPDLQVWTNVQDEPVLRPGPDFYDKNLIAVNQIIKYKGRYYIYYHGQGNTGGNWTTNVAMSTDLVHWKKYPNNPLLPVESNQSSGILIHDDERFRLVTMHREVQVHFATLTSGPPEPLDGAAPGIAAHTSLERIDETENEFEQDLTSAADKDPFPKSFLLHLNYPNPFNIETTIEYDLPEAAEVRMRIFNIKGQIVRSLVDEFQTAGFKRVSWNGKDDFGREVGSGMYVLLLTAGQERQVGKMVLQK